MTIAFRTALLSLLIAGFLVSRAAHGGYTHYFNWQQPPDDAPLAACIQRMSLILEAAGDRIAGPDGTGSPIVEELSLSFNGRSPNDWEPFIFPGQAGFNFCKTAWKPYDAAVTAILITARDCFPQTTLLIASDGSWDDWSAGADLYTEVFSGRPPESLAVELSGGGTLGFGKDYGMGYEQDLWGVILTWLPALLLMAIVLPILIRQLRDNQKASRQQAEHLEKVRRHMDLVEHQLARLIEIAERKDTAERSLAGSVKSK